MTRAVRGRAAVEPWGASSGPSWWPDRRRGARLGLVVVLLAALALAFPRPLDADQGEAPPASALVQGHLAAGDVHTCAVLARGGTSGPVRCWGSNDRAQLGNGTVASSTAPVLVSGISSARAVTAGVGHTCALLVDGTVWCWGLDANGQLGDGVAGEPTTGDPVTRLRTTPVQANGVTGAVAVAAGGFSTCAIVADGTVRCWGDDGAGQQGDGRPGDRTLVPATVPGIPASNGATALAAGSFHTCALLADDTVRCWGHNGFGQLGDGTQTDRATPVRVAGLPALADDPDHAPVALTAGSHHTCVLLQDTSAHCWGLNSSGQVGSRTPDADADGVMDPALSPAVVEHDTDPSPLGEDREPLAGVTAVAGGQTHTCALLASGAASCWGSGGRGQLGTDPDPLQPGLQDSSAAVPVIGLAGASAVTSGGFHSCGVLSGNVHCWGYGFYGQLGHRVAASPVPVQVTTVTGARTVAAGTAAACALVDATTSSAPVCWGDNSSGQLGADLSPGTTPDSTIRVAVAGIPSASALDAGNGHACAVPTGTTSLRCWGRNGDGQLGDGTTTDRTAPVAVPGSYTTAFSAGGGLGSEERGHTCAVRTDSTVACWGRNGNGQLGNGSTTDQTAPVTVQLDADPAPDVVTPVDLTGATAVTTGGFHSCTLTGDRTVWCWGWNGSGQLGDDSTTQRLLATHVQVDTDPDVDAPLTGVLAIAAGYDVTCAVLDTGRAACWGENGRGQVGDGGRPADRPRPALVADVGVGNPGAGITGSPATTITTGDAHTCVRLADDSVLCWGAGSAGQLGTGAMSDEDSPVLVMPPAPSEIPAEARPVVRSLSAGRDGTCVVLVDTTVSCWGDNARGQLGDGIGAARVLPVQADLPGSV